MVHNNMKITENIFNIKTYDKTYDILCVQTGDDLIESKFDFWLLTEDNKIELKTKANNELIRDLYAVMGLDPAAELMNVIFEELKQELEANYD